MNENSKQNDIVTEILDAAFNKDWDDFSPEEYKHQLAETQNISLISQTCTLGANIEVRVSAHSFWTI